MNRMKMRFLAEGSIWDVLTKRGENEKGYNLIKILENIRSTHLFNLDHTL